MSKVRNITITFNLTVDFGSLSKSSDGNYAYAATHNGRPNKNGKFFESSLELQGVDGLPDGWELHPRTGWINSGQFFNSQLGTYGDNFFSVRKKLAKPSKAEADEALLKAEGETAELQKQLRQQQSLMQKMMAQMEEMQKAQKPKRRTKAQIAADKAKADAAKDIGLDDDLAELDF